MTQIVLPGIYGTNNAEGAKKLFVCVVEAGSKRIAMEMFDDPIKAASHLTASNPFSLRTVYMEAFCERDAAVIISNSRRALDGYRIDKTWFHVAPDDAISVVKGVTSIVSVCRLVANGDDVFADDAVSALRQHVDALNMALSAIDDMPSGQGAADLIGKRRTPRDVVKDIITDHLMLGSADGPRLRSVVKGFGYLSNETWHKALVDLEQDGVIVREKSGLPGGAIVWSLRQHKTPFPASRNPKDSPAAKFLVHFLADNEWHDLVDVKSAAFFNDIKSVGNLYDAAAELGVEMARNGKPGRAMKWRMPLSNNRAA